jgi:hypothetical protein
MTPAQASVVIERATDRDLEVAVENALNEAGVTLSELREQAAQGRFSSDEARLAWIVIADIVDAAA